MSLTGVRQKCCMSIINSRVKVLEFNVLISASNIRRVDQVRSEVIQNLCSVGQRLYEKVEKNGLR